MPSCSGYALTAFVVALVQALGPVRSSGPCSSACTGATRSPRGASLLLLAVVGAAVNLIMGTFARTPEQAVAVGVPLGIALGMLGGCMWPLEAVGPLHAQPSVT